MLVRQCVNERGVQISPVVRLSIFSVEIPVAAHEIVSECHLSLWKSSARGPAELLWPGMIGGATTSLAIPIREDNRIFVQYR